MSKIKVLVALSGGVDSAVTAGLLRQEGYQVEGAFMKLADNADFEQGLLTAQVIARQLDFPLRVFDFRQVFLKEVIQPSLQGYKQGLTPNPCVLCNNKIKFGLFLQEATRLGFDFMATGHYIKKKKEAGKFQLWQAKDKAKDQSYFLWRLDQQRLARILFPLGSYLKSEVEEMAKQWELAQFIRSSSQELCFVKKKMKEFLKDKIGEQPGAIFDLRGHFLGKHQGLWFYTIGQRRNLNLAGGPFYVVGKDIARNNLIVSRRRQDLTTKEFFLGEMHWIAGKAPALPYRGQIKIRYLAPPKEGIITKDDSLYRCSSLQEAITPGQSAVVYQDEQVLGGGIIVNKNYA